MNVQHERVLKPKPMLKIQTKDVSSSNKLLLEINNLKLIYLDRVIGIPPETGYNKAIQITIFPEGIIDDNEANAMVVLGLHFPASYPEHIPKIDFIQMEGFSETQKDELFSELFEIGLNNAGGEIIFQIVLQCQKQVTLRNQQIYNEKMSSRNLYDIFMQEEKNKQKQKKLLIKTTQSQEEKENNKSNPDETRLRQEWLETLVDEPTENSEPIFQKRTKVHAWQQLSAMELMLIHLIKIVQKQTKNSHNKLLANLLIQFQITTNKELVKLLSPKYEVIFNNLYVNKFENLAKSEQEKMELKMAEQIQTQKSNDKTLQDKTNLINLYFTPWNKSSSTKLSAQNKRLDDQQLSQSLLQSPNNKLLLIKEPSQNRMEADFEIVSVVGKGSFGQVFKVKNKIDGRFYAIKKIKIPYGQGLTRIMREVDLLSRLHHRFVIRYYQAWIDECEKTDEDYELEEDESDIQLVSGFTQQSDSQFKFNASSIGSSQNCLPSKNDQKTLVLFIQTEYCTRTLRKQIEEVYPKSDQNFIWNQFRQILEGMSYTHQQKIIHRDLKPENIFIDTTEDIKIGDFGLAKHTSKHSHNVLFTSSVENNDEIPEILNFITSQPQLKKEDQELLDRTLNVGTYFYCPPKNESEFDEKRDVFALGVILLEMWHPFQNQHERVKILSQLKVNGKVPKKFSDSHPRQTSLIKWMTNRDPLKRPTIQEILHSELIPPKLEDEYLKEAIKVLGTQNNESIYYQKLIEALFNNKGLSPLDRDRLFHMDSIYPNNFVKQIYIPKIIAFMNQQCVLQLQTPIIIDKPKSFDDGIYKNSCYQQPIYMMNNHGEIVYFRHQLRDSFTKYLQQLNNKLMQNKVIKCFEIGSVYISESEQIRVQNQLNFDEIIFNDDDAIIPTIVLSIQCLETLGVNINKMRINNEEFIKDILFNLGVYDFQEQKLIFQYMTKVAQYNQFNASKLRYFISNDNENSIAKLIIDKFNDRLDKFIILFQYKCKIQEINLIEILQLNQNDDLRQKQLRINDFANRLNQQLLSYRKIKEQSQQYTNYNLNILFDCSINCKKFGFNNGYHYQLSSSNINKINMNNTKDDYVQTSIIYGGTYEKSYKKLQTICSVIMDIPNTKFEINLNHFGGNSSQISRTNSQIGKELPLSKVQSSVLKEGAKLSQVCKQKIEIGGFTLDLDALEEIFSCYQSPTLFKYQVLICSTGGNLQEAKRTYLQACNFMDIPALIYSDDDTYQLEEQISFADKNDIKCLVLIRDKLYQSKQKVIVRYKKDKNNRIDREMTLDEFIQFMLKHKQG